MKVQLISHTAYPEETVFALWNASRSNDPIPTAYELFQRRLKDHVFDREVDKVFKSVIENDIPVAENLEFVFLLEGIPISLREQFVRHRVGHRFGENFGVDIIPGPVDSSFWSQSMRILDMGEFATQGRYYTPDSILRDQDLDDDYVKAMDFIQSLYVKMVEKGVPMEDARQIIPLAATHRISWKVNYQALKHVLGKRGCWISQLGMWKPVIMGMVKELSAICPYFKTLVRPPCQSVKWEWQGCPFTTDNMARVIGKADPLPPCPLYLRHYAEDIEAEVPPLERKWRRDTNGLTWDTERGIERAQFQGMIKEYGAFWGHNPWTDEVVGSVLRE